MAAKRARQSPNRLGPDSHMTPPPEEADRHNLELEADRHNPELEADRVGHQHGDEPIANIHRGGAAMRASQAAEKDAALFILTLFLTRMS